MPKKLKQILITENGVKTNYDNVDPDTIHANGRKIKFSVVMRKPVMTFTGDFKVVPQPKKEIPTDE